MNVIGFSLFEGFIFNNRHGQYGLIDNFWSIESTTLELKPKTQYILDLRKSIKKRLNLRNNCLEDAEALKTGYDHIRCIEGYMVNLLKEKFTEINKKICWIPQADFFIKQMNETMINACQTHEEMEFVRQALSEVMSIANKKIPECLPLCTTEKVDIRQQTNPMFSSTFSGTEIYIYWDTLDVLIEEEYLWFDFNAIVSAVGGSLGLLIGLYCLDFLLRLLTKVENFGCNRK